MKRYIRASKYDSSDVEESLQKYHPDIYSSPMVERYIEKVMNCLKAYESSNMNMVDLDELLDVMFDDKAYSIRFVPLINHGVDVTKYNFSQLKTLLHLIEQGRNIDPLLDPSIPASKMKKYYPSVNSNEFQEAIQLLKSNVNKLYKMKILNYDKFVAGQRFIYLWYLKNLYTKDEVETQLEILEELPQVHSAGLDDGSCEGSAAHKITLVPEVTDDTSLGSASNHPQVTKNPRLQENEYKITYTEFTGTWKNQSGVETLQKTKSFDTDLECFQWVAENLIDLDQYDFVPLDLNSEKSIRNLLDIVNDNDEESVWHLILKIQRGSKIIYKI